MKKVLIVFFMAQLLAIFLGSRSFAGWIIYHKPEFKGKVIDAASREPIKGAIVVATYYSSPIITGPGGGSPYVIHIKETLTDGNGVFVIPSYTTLIQPNSLEAKVEFIIYKAGYGNFPREAVKPNPPVNLERFFAEQIGSEGEFVVESIKGTKSLPVVFGVVELPKLQTEKERLRAIPPPPTEFIKDTPLLYEEINMESKVFGLRPIGR